MPSYFFQSLDFRATDRKMDAFLADFPAGGAASALHEHPGAEFLYVISGRVALEVGEDPVELDEGDAVYSTLSGSTATPRRAMAAPRLWWWCTAELSTEQTRQQA